MSGSAGIGMRCRKRGSPCRLVLSPNPIILKAAVMRWQSVGSRPDHPEGIVAANDLMAIGVMKACEEAGLRIPHDVAVVGMDNLDLASRVYPKLTSVALQEEIGRKAPKS